VGLRKEILQPRAASAMVCILLVLEIPKSRIQLALISIIPSNQ